MGRIQVSLDFQVFSQGSQGLGVLLVDPFDRILDLVLFPEVTPGRRNTLRVIGNKLVLLSQVMVSCLFHLGEHLKLVRLCFAKLVGVSWLDLLEIDRDIS